jgi:hypothetical protein
MMVLFIYLRMVFLFCQSLLLTDGAAFNNREGDYWPHVSSGIPDDWVQESFVSIANETLTIIM